MKTVEREEARRLRREQGASVKEIAARLGVSRSSASLWVRDVELSDAQREALRQRMGGRIDGARVNAVRGRQRRREAQVVGRASARRGDPLHLAGCMLYWAEGSRSRDRLEFVNSDPAMIRFFARFLRTCFGVPDEKIRIRCSLFADHAARQREVEQFWLDLLGLPRTSMTKSRLNIY